VSRAEVGSSRTIRDGDTINALARATLCLSPPLRAWGYFFKTSVLKPTRLITSSAFSSPLFLFFSMFIR
jgi:hypothetical protein